VSTFAVEDWFTFVELGTLFDPGLMNKCPVSNRVNRPENDNETYAEEIPLDNARLNLFELPPNPS
jgi:hypothetical protein